MSLMVVLSVSGSTLLNAQVNNNRLLLKKSQYLMCPMCLQDKLLLTAC